MFIEKSKQAISVIDAHTGERDYLKVDKDSTGFTIKVPAGKTKLKITKWYGVGQERTQEFDVVGSGSEKGVSGMTQITTGNAFAEDYCENYSGYGANSLENDCTPKIVGAVDGVAVYRTPCQKEFFEFELSANQKIELFVEDVVLIEKTYSVTLKQNLSVKETLGLKAFEDYFGTGVILNELHEADRVFFADGLPIEVGLNGDISIFKGYDESIVYTYGMVSINCAYTKNEESKYVAIRRHMYFYFVEDEAITANYEYAFNNFIPQKDIYFSFQFGKVWMQTIFGFERTEAGTERMWLWKENHEEELTEFEDMSLSLLSVFKKHLEDNELQFTPSEILNGSGLLATSYGGGFSHTADFYPVFYSSDTYVLGIANPISTKCLKTQFKFLENIRDFGLYPSIGTPYDTYYVDVVGGAINERNVAGWNNKNVIDFLAGNVSLGLATSCLALNSDDEYDNILAIEGGKEVSYCLKRLDKNYIPNANIFVKPEILYSKKTTFDANKKIFYTSLLTEEAVTVKNFILAHVSKISTINFRSSTMVLSKNSMEASLFDDISTFLNNFADDFMHVSETNYFSLGSLISKNVLVTFDWLMTGGSDASLLRCFVKFMNGKGGILRADNNSISCSFIDGRVSYDLSCLYAVLDSDEFKLDSLLLANVEFSTPTYGSYCIYDFTKTWVTYSQGTFLVRERIGFYPIGVHDVIDSNYYSVSMPHSLKTFLENVVILEINKAYEALCNIQITIVETGEATSVLLNDSQIEGILRTLFNQYIYKKSMIISMDFEFSFRVYITDNNTTVTVEKTFNSGAIDVSLPSSLQLSFSSGHPTTLSSSLLSINSISGTYEEPNLSPNEVTITVTDASKTRTIVYTSPIEIASISVDGERIDVGNRMIDADIPRKFSIGNATVTWKNSTITVYNFGAVMSLKIGDASFII